MLRGNVWSFNQSFNSQRQKAFTRHCLRDHQESAAVEYLPDDRDFQSNV